MTPITREEKIMSGENLTPITRKELFLAKATGQDVETPTPITREEMFLDKIQGSGGGGSALPSQKKTIDITENGTVEVTPDYGYTLSKVTANVNVDAEIFVETGDVEIFLKMDDDIFDIEQVIHISLDKDVDVLIQTVPTLPQKLIKSDETKRIFIYVDEQTGIAYANFDGNNITAGMAFTDSAEFDKGWTNDINSVTENGFYCVPKEKDIKETPVLSSFDNTGDGIPEVYLFSKELPTRFSSYNYIKIDAVNDITDNNGVHQEAGTHYLKYDEVAAGIGTLPPHVYCYDNSSNYLRYSFYVPEDGIYELAAHIRIKDEQLRGATYTINKGTKYEHSFVTTYGWSSKEEALTFRDEQQGAYMSGMLVHLHAGNNTIHITVAAGVTKNQHFRELYFVKNSDLPKYPYALTMDQAEQIGINLAKGAILPDYYHIKVTFNNGAPRETDGFCRVITSNGNKMSIQKITLDYGQTMPTDGSTVTLRGKIGCVNSTVNGSMGKEARIFEATIYS